MLKQLSLAMIAAVVLTGCGGDGGDNKSPSFTPIIGPASSSSSVSSESSASSESSSSSVDSTPALSITYDFEENIDGWFVNGDGTNILLDHDSEASALIITPLAWSDTDNWKRQARVEFEEAIDFVDAVITVVINIPESYKKNGDLGLQLVLQGAGYADTWRGMSDLEVGDNTIVWNVEAEEGVTHFGIQLTQPPSEQTILDPILVKSVNIEIPGSGSSSSSSSAGSGNVIEVAVDSGWRDNNGGTMTYIDDGVEVTATAANHGAVFDMDEPQNFVGTTLEVVVRVSEDYQASGAGVESFAQVKGTWEGVYCNHTDVVTDEDMTLTCTIEDAVFDSPSTGVQFGVQAPGGSTPDGTFIIKSAKLILAE